MHHYANSSVPTCVQVKVRMMLVKVLRTTGKPQQQKLRAAERAPVARCTGHGGDRRVAQPWTVTSHVGVTMHTGLWDKHQPQFCPCKGPLIRDVFSLLLHPHIACENIPIAREQSHLPHGSFGTHIFFCKHRKSSYMHTFKKYYPYYVS